MQRNTMSNPGTGWGTDLLTLAHPDQRQLAPCAVPQTAADQLSVDSWPVQYPPLSASRSVNDKRTDGLRTYQYRLLRLWQYNQKQMCSTSVFAKSNWD
jgi:hypothetical protein